MIGAVAGALVGGALGVVVAKRVRAGGARSLIPAKAPVVGRRALSALKGVAAGAAAVAKVAASEAAGQALAHMKTVAQELVVDVTGRGAAAAAPAPAQSDEQPAATTPKAPRRTAARTPAKRQSRRSSASK